MISRVQNFNLFTPFWKKFEKYARGEGLTDAALMKALAGETDKEETMKVGACLNHWLMNHSSETDQQSYALVFSEVLKKSKEEPSEEETICFSVED